MSRLSRFVNTGLLTAALLTPALSFAQLPFPRRGTTRSSKEQQPTGPEVTITGMVRKIDADWLLVESDDHRIISFRLNTKSILQKQSQPAKLTDFQPGDHVTVDANTGENGQLFALTVSFEKAGTSGERVRASRPVQDAPIPVRQAERTGSADPDDERPRLRRAGSPASTKPGADDDDDDKSAATNNSKKAPAPEVDEASIRDTRPTTTVQDSDVLADDRPRVRRGIQPARPRPKDEDSTEVAVVTPPRPAPGTPAPHHTPPRPVDSVEDRSNAAPAGDPFIEKTREAIAHFTEGLPNYTVQQYTTRYMSDTPKAQFRPQDVISTDLVYEGGREHYRNIKVNNKVSKKNMEELGGAWSTGEFATTILDVFSPTSNADFRFRRNTTIVNRPARVYDYRVAQETSHWTVLTTSQSYKPAYQGRVWIDTETNLILRLEMEAKGLPQDFPLDHVEMTLDYDFVRLSGPTFLLPVQTENLSCQRGTSYCSKNTTEFRNYKKYSSESSITFDK